MKMKAKVVRELRSARICIDNEFYLVEIPNGYTRIEIGELESGDLLYFRSNQSFNTCANRDIGDNVTIFTLVIRKNK